MKKLIFCLVLLSPITSFACSCADPEDMIGYDVSQLQGIDSKTVEVSDVQKTYQMVYAIPNAIKEALSNDAMEKCVLSCSSVGVRLKAVVTYPLEGKVCTANYLKRARNEEKFSLKNVVCQ